MSNPKARRVRLAVLGALGAVCCGAIPLGAQGALGVSGSTVSGAISGMMVRVVPPGSAGALADLRPGDIIVSYNGTRIASAEEVVARVRKSQPGDTVKLGVLRGRRAYQMTLTLQAPGAGRQPGAARAPDA